VKLIIAGSRTITDRFEVVKAVSQALAEWQEREIVEIVSGGAKGVDTIAEEFAEQFGVAFKEFPADWDKHGKKSKSSQQTGASTARRLATSGTYRWLTTPTPSSLSGMARVGAA